MAQRFVGIDFGAHTLRLLELIDSPRSLEVGQYHEEPVEWRGDREQAQLEALRRAAKHFSLRADAIAVSLDTTAFISTHIDLPFDDPKLIKNLLVPIVSDKVPLGEDDVMDYSIMGPSADGEGFDTLVVVGPAKKVEETLRVLEEIECDPQIAAPLAFTEHHSAAYLFPEEEGLYALIDIGADQTHCTIMQGIQYQASRSILSGGHQMTVSLAKILEIDESTAENLKRSRGFIAPKGQEGDWAAQLDMALPHSKGKVVDQAEIARAMREGLRPVLFGLRQMISAYSAQVRMPITRIELAGGAAELPGLSQYIQAQLGVETHRLKITPPSLHRAMTEAGSNSAIIAPLALAISASASLSGETFHFNLRRGRLAFKGGLDFLKEHALSILLMIGALIFAVLFLLGAKYQAIGIENDQAKADLLAASTALFGESATTVDEIDAQLEAGVVSVKIPQRTAYYHLMMVSTLLDEAFEVEEEEPPPTPEGEEAVEPPLSPNFEFRRLEIDNKIRKITIKGAGSSDETVNKILQTLSSYKCFPERLVESKRQTDREIKTGDYKYFEITFKAESCIPGAGDN